MAIKWLFFDVGSTLVNEQRAYEHRIRDMIEGTDITYERFCETMMGYYYRNLKGDLETARQFGLKVTPWHSEDEEPYPDAEACLRELRKQYRIGVIANQKLGTASRLETFGLLQYIDLVISSAEEGVSKPDPRIFQLALERAECHSEEAVMIGDRLDNDVVPAKRLGMKTVWIRQGFGGLSDPALSPEQPDSIVKDLRELVKLLLKNTEKDEMI